MMENEITTDSAEASPMVKRPRSPGRFDTGSMFVAMLVVAAGSGLYYMHWRTAEALKLVQGAETEAASVETFVTGGKASLTTLARSIRETQETVARLTGTPEPAAASALFDARDPFEFETLEPAKPDTEVAQVSNSARDQQKAKLLADARTMHIDSIMFGSTRRSCLINGKLYFEGQSCGEFTVASIAPDAVFVQNGEFRFELRFRR